MRRARRRGMIELTWESVQEEVADACGSEVGGTRAHAARSSQAPPWSAAIVLLGTGAPGPRLRCRTGSLKPGWLHSRAAGQGGVDLTPEQGYEAARLSALTILSSLKRELGDLDRVTAWLMVYGLVNADPDFTLTTNVINGFSDLILEVYGPEAGTHARMAPGLATLPLGVPVTIAAEVAISS